MHRCMGQFFSRGTLPQIFLSVPKKTAMLTCKITLPDSPHPTIISLSQHTEWIPCFSFNKHKKIYFAIFVCWLLHKKFSFCPKNNGFAWVGGGGLQPSQPSWLIYVCSNGCSSNWTNTSWDLWHSAIIVIGLWAEGSVGGSPPESAKHFLGQSVNFWAAASNQKWQIFFLFIKKGIHSIQQDRVPDIQVFTIFWVKRVGQNNSEWNYYIQ